MLIFTMYQNVILQIIFQPEKEAFIHFLITSHFDSCSVSGHETWNTHTHTLKEHEHSEWGQVILAMMDNK